MPQGGRLRIATSTAAARLRLGCVLPLAQAIRLYGFTDKLSHGYVHGYVRHLRGRRWTENRVLEIGVGGYESRTPGGSLRVWRDYLPRSVIVGMDISEKDVRLGRRVKFVQGDQTSRVDLDRAIAALGGTPDVVIDDGSHLVGDAARTFRYLFPLMPAGSLYVIEDLHTSYWVEWGGRVPAPDDTAVGLIRSLVDAAQASDRVFDWFPKVPAPPAIYPAVKALDVRGGVAFIVKA